METAEATFRNEPTATAEAQNMQITKKRKSAKPTSATNKKIKKKKEVITEKENEKEENHEEIVKTPERVPTEEVSSPEFSPPEAPLDAPIQSHTNIDLATFDALNSANVEVICSERDKMRTTKIISLITPFLEIHMLYRQVQNQSKLLPIAIDDAWRSRPNT